MKTLNYLLLLCVLFLTPGCEKKNELAADFKVLKDGKEWVSTTNSAVYSIYDKKFMIHAQKGPNFSAEILYIAFELNDLSSPGEYRNLYSTIYELVGGDIISDQFRIIPDPYNYILITSIDTIGKKISGAFNFKLSREARYNKPDTLLLSDGYFSLPYQERYEYN